MKKPTWPLLPGILVSVIALSTVSTATADTPRRSSHGSSVSTLVPATESREDARLRDSILDYHLRNGHELNPQLQELADVWLRQTLEGKTNFDDWDQSLVYSDEGEAVGYIARQYLRHADASIARLNKRTPTYPQLMQVGVATGQDARYVYAVETFLLAEQ